MQSELTHAVQFLQAAIAIILGLALGEALKQPVPDGDQVILGDRMPLDRSPYVWLDAQEQGDRKNARVIDRLVVALPAELTREQNIELLNAYGECVTQGRTPWMAAMHDGPGDVDNPHAHMIFRDRDVDTGHRPRAVRA